MSRPILEHKRSAWLVNIGIVTHTIFMGADAVVLRTYEMGTIEPTTDGEAVRWEAPNQ